MKNLRSYWFLPLLLLISGCGVYSFTGGAIPSEVKTISIATFANESGSGPPTMVLQTTEKIKTYYQSNSRLTLVPNDGDWRLSGSIVKYSVAGVAAQANQTTALSRLTITLNVIFVNTKDESKNFEQAFSFYGDFPRDQSLSSVEGTLVGTILDQIVFDIFTKTTSNW